MLYAAAAAARILDTLELFALLGGRIRPPAFLSQVNQHDFRKNGLTNEDNMLHTEPGPEHVLDCSTVYYDSTGYLKSLNKLNQPSPWPCVPTNIISRA